LDGVISKDLPTHLFGILWLVIDCDLVDDPLYGCESDAFNVRREVFGYLVILSAKLLVYTLLLFRLAESEFTI